jgi:hypothetical protein
LLCPRCMPVLRGSSPVGSVGSLVTDQSDRDRRMRESDVIGSKDALECRKNQPIILHEIRERMEQFQYCSLNGVIHPLSVAWSVFHVPLLPAFLSRCMLDASVERKVSRLLAVVNDEGHHGRAADGTLQRRRKLHFWMRLRNRISKR